MLAKEREQLRREERYDSMQTSLTTMAKNSEVLRCSTELKHAFKAVPNYYRSLVEQSPDELNEHLSHLQKDFGHKQGKEQKRSTTIMTDGKFDRSVRMTLQYKKELFKRKDLDANQDFVEVDNKN